MTDDGLIERARALLILQSSGPWTVGPYYSRDGQNQGQIVHDVLGASEVIVARSVLEPDAAFIAAAPALVRDLLTYVETLREQRDRAMRVGAASIEHLDKELKEANQDGLNTACEAERLRAELAEERQRVEQMKHEVFEANEDNFKCGQIAAEVGCLVANKPSDAVQTLADRYTEAIEERDNKLFKRLKELEKEKGHWEKHAKMMARAADTEKTESKHLADFVPSLKKKLHEARADRDRWHAEYERCCDKETEADMRALKFSMELEEACKERDVLRELLAVLNSDGGQHAELVGYEEATKNALAKYHAMVAELDQLRYRLDSNIDTKKFIPWPHDVDKRYNGSSSPCDMWTGPCSCGAWHTEGK